MAVLVISFLHFLLKLFCLEKKILVNYVCAIECVLLVRPSSFVVELLVQSQFIDMHNLVSWGPTQFRGKECGGGVICKDPFSGPFLCVEQPASIRWQIFFC